MTLLTEAEKAHGWEEEHYKHTDKPRYEWMSYVYVTEHLVWIDGYVGDGVDDLILALLQAKGIHRRLRAEMTNTTHGGTDGH